MAAPNDAERAIIPKVSVVLIVKTCGRKFVGGNQNFCVVFPVPRTC